MSVFICICVPDIGHISALKAVQIPAILVAADSDIAITARTLFQVDGSIVARCMHIKYVLLIQESVDVERLEQSYLAGQGVF